MALFNYASKEITLKVVYYGPGLCGKTTNLQKLHTTMSSDKKGKLLSLSTDADRTLFFDFMPVMLGKIKDFNIRFQLYTVPGQVRYNATRKLVLKGADAVVFVADSQKAMKDPNIDSLNNMKENLSANNINPDEIPVVLQYNKRDLKNIMSVDEMNADINPTGNSIIEASAFEGWGVDETFKRVTKDLLQFISKKHNIQIGPPEDEGESVVPRQAAAAAPEPKPEPAPVPPADDQINISVKDKADDVLAQDSASSYANADMGDMLETDTTGADLPSDEDWVGGQDDIDSAFAAATGSLPPLDEAPVTAEFDAPVADDDIFADTPGAAPTDSGLLEKMLSDEQQGKDSSIESLASTGAGDTDDTSMSADIVSEILSEIHDIKKKQDEMYEGMKQMSMALKTLMSRLQPKQPTRK